jgi:hypothetical protein
LEGVLADISFEIRATSWSSSEIIGDAGDVIDNVVLISSAWYFMSTSVPEKVTLVQNTVGDVTSWAPVKSTKRKVTISHHQHPWPSHMQTISMPGTPQLTMLVEIRPYFVSVNRALN